MIYPSLPARHDFGVFRIGGAGIGNCLFAYFHAVVLAREAGERLVAPTWPSVRIGPLLRGERSYRMYGTMFQAHPDEVSGLAKAAYLAMLWPRRRSVRIRIGQPAQVPPGGLSIVEAPEFTFVGLHEHRAMIRRRLLEILTIKPASEPSWGTESYAGVHIRLGDFAKAQPGELDSGNVPNLRIPLAWYAQAIRRLRSILPEMSVRIFSDGREEELSEVLSTNHVTLQREPSDIADLLALAQARLLIGSNSTFSQWAAFLGNMPTIWLESSQPPEQPTGKTVPILYVGDNTDAITREALLAA